MSRLPPGSTSTATLFPSTTLFRSAFLAAATLSPDGDLGAGMLATGAGVALTSHLLKSGARAMMNTSPEPVRNWTASFTEDAAVVGALALALDRQSDVSGKSVSVRVDLGGRRYLKNPNTSKTHSHQIRHS